MIRGEINFLDNSVLMVREFVDVELTIDRDMYFYQYMTASNNLIFRYDNTRHLNEVRSQKSEVRSQKLFL
ncbi:MAG: hypothetical protein F6K54_33455 [Okeania sp. SIO3B5]|uniref:toxin-antitoxin system TumE family protein n=1 Tax=Okeania sp. SIO3B5 TaxID=2607811 RepID=UPI001400523C|nr:DUF6516 family protein [Okeania sp. SIO3B5]NEO57550.1 hypothetical protein [Okeania sp. SIO3B5]